MVCLPNQSSACGTRGMINSISNVHSLGGVSSDKIQQFPPRKELEIPEGWGGGSMAQEITEGRRGE